MTMTSPLIASLLRPEAYPHDVGTVQLRQTHISWVLLTGEFAYKIKQPVDLGFVDFTTLERRRRFCEEEVRLNNRFTTDLYLDVVPITTTNSESGFQVGGAGAPVEFAVRMRQFDEGQLALRMLKEQRLTTLQVDELAVATAAFHQSAKPARELKWGLPAHVKEPVVANFTDLRPLVHETSQLRQLDQLEEWSIQTFERLSPTFARRQEDGFVRECHGDLHLGNIVNWRGALTPFDCIEFNPALRWIDVMNEVAFLIMDLDDHGRGDLAWRFLNCYLEETGDYAGVSVLPFYIVYRAVVRAKVDALRLHQAGLPDCDRLTADGNAYLELAQRYTRRHQASLMITCGVSGSGKTTATQAHIEQNCAIRVRSDVERKRLCGMQALDHREVGVDTGPYSPSASEATYARLLELARGIVQTGLPAVIDATFLRRWQREKFRSLAGELGVPFHILMCGADALTLGERIRHRQSRGDDASDAGVDVLQHQLRIFEPLTAHERRFVVSPTSPGAAADTP